MAVSSGLAELKSLEAETQDKPPIRMSRGTSTYVKASIESMCDIEHRFSVRRLSVQVFGGVDHVASQHGEAIHHGLGVLCPSALPMVMSSPFCVRLNVSLTS